MNTQEQSDLAAAFGVQAIPTLAVFRDQVLLFQQPGMLPGPALDQILNRVRALDMAQVRKQATERKPAN